MQFFCALPKAFLVVSLSHRRLSWTMGLWDGGTMGRRGQQEEKLFSLSHCLIFSLSFFWKMGLCDDGTMGRRGHQLNLARSAPYLSVFTFHFSLPSERTVRQGEPLRTFVRSFVRFGRKMRLWDYGTLRPPIKHSVADTTPFRFHFSLFTSLRTHRSPGGAPPNVRSFVRSLWEENETMGLWDVAATN